MIEVFFSRLPRVHSGGPMISEAARFLAGKRGFKHGSAVKDQRCMRAELPPDRQVQDFL
jgi:hypothetical protein